MSSFARVLEDHLVRLADLRKRGGSEDTIRDAFLVFLRAAFPRLEQNEPILLESHIPALRVRGGFADALFGNLIFEFKKQLRDQERAAGQEELSRYLKNQRYADRYVGILTDGESLEVYALREDNLRKTDELFLSLDNAGEAKVALDCYLFHEKQLTPTANDVALRFGERSPTFWHSLRLVESLWSEAGATSAAQTKFIEWQSLLSIVYGSSVGDEPLFLRHTYLALFARALAFVALERRAPDAAELAGLVVGETFERMGFDNFVGEDFFTWMIQSDSAETVGQLLHALSTRLTVSYDLAAIGEDLLKELYQELVDPETRHDLGEFYTPDWLAELTLRRAGFPPLSATKLDQPSVLDPSCGSGTFLFTAVRLLRQSGAARETLVRFCAEHVVGVDVHPLAIIIAKTNLLLALGEDVRGYRSRFSLPVYMADSLSTVGDGTRHAEIEVKVSVAEIAGRSKKAKPRGLPAAFGVPPTVAERPVAFHSALDSMLEFADPNLDEEAATEGFLRRIAELGFPPEQGHQWGANLDLMRWLLQPPATDSVWRFILKNAYQPELLARRKFRFVVGNPPWLSYRYVKRRDYQERVRRLVARYGLLEKSKGNLSTQMELATVFFALSDDRYLSDGGTLAFVMPRSVMTGAKQHTEFRKRYLTTAELLIDCEQVTPLFNVPACVVIRKQQQEVSRASAAVPTLHLQGQLLSRNASLSDAERSLEQTDEKYVPPVAKKGSPYWHNVIQGACLAPRCAWFVRPPEAARAVDVGRPQIETDTSTETKAKAPWKGIRLSGAVEQEFLFATLLSANMVPFGWRRFSLIALPLLRERGNLGLLDVSAAVRLGKAGLADWLRKANKIWKENRKSESSLLDWINWQGKLTGQDPNGSVKLLYNEAGSHICSCVLDANRASEWGTVYGLPANGFIADYTTYSFDTKDSDEAHYLCAILNAPSVDAAIKPYQTKGLFGAQKGKGERHIHRRPFEVLEIPRYDKANAQHQELAGISRQCHQVVHDASAHPDEASLTMPVGRLRTSLRKGLLQNDLRTLDAVVSQTFEVIQLK